MGDSSILPLDALRGRAIGLSVSDSPDLGRLGLAELHLRLALGEITRSVLIAGGGLVYGGHLEAGGYTAFLQSELEKYGRSDQPLLVCLAWQEHRERSVDELVAAEEALGMLGAIRYLSPDGELVDKRENRDESPQPVDDPQLRSAALTGLRRHLTEVCDARVLIGGRREGFQGAMPGVIEEASLAVRARQPMFLAGGFGGATHDAASALGLQVERWPRPADGPEWLSSLVRASEGSDWSPELNGLSREENLRLAATHRPSDVAALVALGLGRLEADDGDSL